MKQVLLAASMLALQIHAFKIHFYTGNQCSGMSTGEPMVLGPNQGCQTAQYVTLFSVDTNRSTMNRSGIANGIVVESTGVVDDTFYLVKYSTNDCNPDSEVARDDSGCVPTTYGSFNVVDTLPRNKTSLASVDKMGNIATNSSKAASAAFRKELNKFGLMACTIISMFWLLS